MAYVAMIGVLHYGIQHGSLAGKWRSHRKTRCKNRAGRSRLSACSVAASSTYFPKCTSPQASPPPGTKVPRFPDLQSFGRGFQAFSSSFELLHPGAFQFSFALLQALEQTSLLAADSLEEEEPLLSVFKILWLL